MDPRQVSMKISFVIPARNEEARIGACIEHIQKAVAANPINAEIVVVVNNTTDRTEEVARSYGVVVIHSAPGITVARKEGVLHSSAGPSDLIGFVDADALLPEKGWLDVVKMEFSNDPQLIALSGPFVYYDLSAWNRGMTIVFYFFGYVLYLLNRFVFNVGSMLQGGNFVVRKDALMRLGGYDTTAEFYGEDTNIAIKLHRLHMGGVKWTWKLKMPTSGRRLKKEGVLKTGFTYALNHIVPMYFGHVATKSHKDYR